MGRKIADGCRKAKSGNDRNRNAKKLVHEVRTPAKAACKTQARKGKGKRGPRTGCFECKGDHYASERSHLVKPPLHPDQATISGKRQLRADSQKEQSGAKLSVQRSSQSRASTRRARRGQQNDQRNS